MKHFIISFAAIVSFFISCKTIEVQQFDSADKKNESAVYKLPQTQLLFEITLKTTTYEKNPLGCFDNYKDVFKGIVAKGLMTKLIIPHTESVVTSKVSSAVISALPVTDQGKVFAINTSGNFFNNRVYGINIDDNGVLSKGEFVNENIAVPLISQIISSAAGFVNPFVTARGIAGVAIDQNQTCDGLYERYKQIYDQKQDFNSLTPFKLANSLPSKELYERVLLELENEKTAIFNQLMFSTDIQLDKINIRFTPAIKDVTLINGELLFGFIKNANNEPELYINKELVGEGSNFASSTPGVTVISKTKADILAIKNIQAFYLKILPVDWDKDDFNAATGNPSTAITTDAASTDKGGLYYNIPLSCKVYLQKGKDNNWAESNIMFPQWGKLGRLSDKMTKQVIELNPLYGNLKSLQGESKTITTDQVKTFGESLAQARDVFYTDPVTKMERRIKYLETKEKLSEAEGTELSELKKQKDLLQAQKEILELKKAIKEFEE